MPQCATAPSPVAYRIEHCDKLGTDRRRGLAYGDLEQPLLGLEIAPKRPL
jgi:hypothetical protein